jgi:hypothetical protein
MANRLRLPLLAVAVVALAATTGAARADWLVTKDGGRVETKGPWKVDGRRIIFTLPNGMLSSMRADDVDLDQSAAVTAQAVEAAQAASQPKPEPKKAPILTLTEKDIPPSPGEGEEAAPAEAGAEKGAATTSQLQVTDWQKMPTGDGDGVEIFGTLRNDGNANITSPSVMVMIYGPDGGLLATNEATVNAGFIAPGKTANFRVAFPGVPDFTAAKFDAQGRGFRTTPEGTTGEGGEGGGEGGEATPDQGAPQPPPAAAPGPPAA